VLQRYPSIILAVLMFHMAFSITPFLWTGSVYFSGDSLTSSKTLHLKGKKVDLGTDGEITLSRIIGDGNEITFSSNTMNLRSTNLTLDGHAHFDGTLFVDRIESHPGSIMTIASSNNGAIRLVGGVDLTSADILVQGVLYVFHFSFHFSYLCLHNPLHVFFSGL
jgi:hypothetical protein